MSGLLNTPARRVLRDRLITGGSAVAVMALLAVPAGAVEYSFGEIAGSVDTVISAGASMRTSDRNCENIGKSGGGCQKFDASGIDKTLAGSQGDDGNLNYDQWDVFSGALKATSEIQAGFRNFTAFVRGTAHVDPLVDNVDFRELEGPQRSEVSHNAKLLDYFVVGSFEVGELPLEVKVGNQVISWGESTFIQNGLNVINPIDISAIRKPGSEVKEFFVPILAAKASLGLPNNFSLESYYQFKSDNIVPDPSGTYFSSADIVGRGSQPLRLGISDFGDDDRYNPFASTLGLDPDGRANTTFFTNNGAAAFVAANPTSIVGSEAFGGWATPVNIAYGAKPTGVNVTSASIERANDDNAKNGGEFGVALRYFAEELNNGSEFGMFFVKYHSRLPLVSLSRINPATGYSNSTPGFNLGQFSAAGDPAHVRSVQQAAAIAQQNAQAAVLGQGAVGNGGLSPALAPYLSGVGSGAGNTAVDAYEMAQFTCNVIAATNRNAMNARGVGNAQGGAPVGFTGAGGANATAIRNSVNLALPGGYTNCNNGVRLRRNFSAQLDRVLLALPVQTMTYRLQYPEDINLLGLSGSTTFGSVAVQAEATYRPDQPLQYALGEMFRGALDVVGGTAFVTGAASNVDANGAAPGQGFVSAAEQPGNALAANHTVADLDAVADGAIAPGTRGRFDPFNAQVGRAVAATTAQIAAAATAGANCRTCTFAEVALIEGFTSNGGTFAGHVGGRTPGLAAAADAAATGTLTAGTLIAGVPITALQAATWNQIGFVVIDPLGVTAAGAPAPLGTATTPANPAVISAMPNDVVFARHVDSGIVNPIQNAAVVNEGDFGSDGFVKSPNKDVYTAQATATSILFGSNAIVQFARADQGVAVTEVGMVFVPGISTSDGFSSSNTVGLANYSAAQTYKVNADMLLGSNYATELSYGVQGIFNLTYNRAFGSAFNLVPQIAWRWDLGGRTPAPLGNYMAERKAIGLQLGANYQSRWQGSVSWTANFGPDAPLDDRDFASINVSYAF